jgi:F-type H+-transporting ATPase subunit a
MQDLSGGSEEGDGWGSLDGRFSFEHDPDCKKRMSLIASHIAVIAELNPLEPVAPVPLFEFSIGGLRIVISNHAFTVLVAAVLLLLLIPRATRSAKLVPAGLQNVVESICVFLRDQMARNVLGSHTDQYIGLLWTTFFFVLTLNLIGMIPTEKIVSLATGGKWNHVGGPPTANIFVTGAMAAVAIVATLVFGIRQHGFIGYLASIAPPVPWWLLPLLYPLELLSMAIRPFTLAIRLFANIIAGHMVVGTILGLILIFGKGVAIASVPAAAALSLLDLLVAFIQAYIFTFLFTLYVGSAVSSGH